LKLAESERLPVGRPIVKHVAKGLQE